MKEVLLRDIYEFIPAKAYLVAALLLVLASEFAFAIPVVAFTLAGLFLLRAAVLFRRGWRVRRYQRNLTGCNSSVWGLSGPPNIRSALTT